MAQTIINKNGYRVIYAAVSQSFNNLIRTYEFPPEFIKGVEFSLNKPAYDLGSYDFQNSSSLDSSKLKLHVYDTQGEGATTLSVLYNLLNPIDGITHTLILYPKVPGGKEKTMTQQIYISSMSLDFIEMPTYDMESSDKSYFTIHFGYNYGQIRLNGIPYQ